MFSIRKFVGYAGAAAGLSAALLIGMSTQTGLAAVSSTQRETAPVNEDQPPISLSPACAAAVQALKAAAVADAAEDRTEYLIRANTIDTGDAAEDSTELAGFNTLVRKLRTACAPPAAATPPSLFTRSPAPSSQCLAALQALKAAWAQRPTTRAEWAQLEMLAMAARTACGFTERR